MPQKYDTVIADTSCFILLDKISELIILKNVFGRITTTHAIAKEFGKSLPSWIEVRSPVDEKHQSHFEVQLDPGEASAFALAAELKNVLLILDDAKARKLAEILNYNYTGTLGILLRAKEMGIIPSLKPVLEKIQKTNFRFSAKVLNDILKDAGED